MASMLTTARSKSPSREKSYFFCGGKYCAKSAGSTSASCSSGKRTTPASRKSRATSSPPSSATRGMDRQASRDERRLAEGLRERRVGMDRGDDDFEPRLEPDRKGRL